MEKIEEIINRRIKYYQNDNIIIEKALPNSEFDNDLELDLEVNDAIIKELKLVLTVYQNGK